MMSADLVVIITGCRVSSMTSRMPRVSLCSRSAGWALMQRDSHKSTESFSDSNYIAERLLQKGRIRRNDAAENRVAAYFIIKTRQAVCDELVPHLRKIPEVVVFDSIAGETDGLVEVVADSMTRLQAVRSEIAALPDVVTIETSVILKRHFNRR